MTYVLIPGRHLITTDFQDHYFKKILNSSLEELEILNKNKKLKPIKKIIFAITSSNQSHSRYNPIPFHNRLIGIDRFAKQFQDNLNIQYESFGIPHYRKSKNFIDITLKEIEEQSNQRLKLTPKNTIVLCSTKSIIDEYIKKGFSVLPAELDYKKNIYHTLAPQPILEKLIENKKEWITNSEIKSLLSISQVGFFKDFPEILDYVEHIFDEPLLTDSGSLTEDRDYSSYSFQMSNEEILNVKYDEIKPFIKEGKIVDEGCADGALLVKIGRDYPDSDLIGIEITSEFIARCKERQRSGEFGQNYVYFHQRNLLKAIFKENSIDTCICNSTTHELWSYANQKKSLTSYFKKKFKQLKKGGRLIIRDVVGPENKNKKVLLKLNCNDGKNIDKPLKKVTQKELGSLSTYGLFVQFSQDFLKELIDKKIRKESDKITYSIKEINNVKYIETTMKNAYEFLSKKDYIDNWYSEMNEEFGFWNLSDWKNELEKIGFRVLEESRSYTSKWIKENRFENKVEIFEENENKLKKINYPTTNMILVSEK
jgi:cyclopropane fatty-acyl-phospholipid synthase-like methyltransferase